MQMIISVVLECFGLFIGIYTNLVNLYDISNKKKIRKLRIALIGAVVLCGLSLFIAFSPTVPSIEVTTTDIQEENKDIITNAYVKYYPSDYLDTMEVKCFDKMRRHWIDISAEDILPVTHIITVTFDAAEDGEDYVYRLSVPPYSEELNLGVFDQPVTIQVSSGRYQLSLGTYRKHSFVCLSSGIIDVDASGEHVIPSNEKKATEDNNWYIYIVVGIAIISFALVIIAFFRLKPHRKNTKTA